MRRFENSKKYWEERYKNEGTSGAGSYGRLAEFKASTINEFIKDYNIKTAIELGCGDGNQLSLINVDDYTGIDVSSTVVETCKKRFVSDPNKKFYTTSEFKNQTAELLLSLDVIYHLVEDETYHNYMLQLFNLATWYVIIYSSNLNKAGTSDHVKHRCFTDWVSKNASNWHLQSYIKNKYPATSDNAKNNSFADFYIFSKQ